MEYVVSTEHKNHRGTRFGRVLSMRTVWFTVTVDFARSHVSIEKSPCAESTSTMCICSVRICTVHLQCMRMRHFAPAPCAHVQYAPAPCSCSRDEYTRYTTIRALRQLHNELIELCWVRYIICMMHDIHTVPSIIGHLGPGINLLR